MFKVIIPRPPLVTHFRRLTILILAAALFLSACSEQNDEDQIAQNLAAIEEAVEAKNFSVIEQYLHKSFVANESMGIDEIRQLLTFYGLRHKKLTATVVGSSTTFHANFSGRATSIVSVIVTGSSSFLPSDGSIRKVEIEWIESSGSWLIAKATWRR